MKSFLFILTYCWQVASYVVVNNLHTYFTEELRFEDGTTLSFSSDYDNIFTLKGGDSGQAEEFLSAFTLEELTKYCSVEAAVKAFYRYFERGSEDVYELLPGLTIALKNRGDSRVIIDIQSVNDLHQVANEMEELLPALGDYKDLLS